MASFFISPSGHLINVSTLTCFCHNSANSPLNFLLLLKSTNAFVSSRDSPFTVQCSSSYCPHRFPATCYLIPSETAPSDRQIHILLNVSQNTTDLEQRKSIQNPRRGRKGGFPTRFVYASTTPKKLMDLMVTELAVNGIRKY